MKVTYGLKVDDYYNGMGRGFLLGGSLVQPR
jgi:hypothetical protein